MGLNSGLAVYLLTHIVFCAKHPASFTRHTHTNTNKQRGTGKFTESPICQGPKESID